MRIASVLLKILVAALFASAQVKDPKPPVTPNPVTAPQKSTGALDDALLEQADGDEKLVYIRSYVTFEYRRDRFDDGSTGDSEYLVWLQSFGPSKRLAAGIELPVIYESGPAATGLGDIRLGFKGMLSKGERFEYAAGIEITLPSGSQKLIDEGHIIDGQTVLGVAWGSTMQLARHTVLDANLHYDQAVHNRTSAPKRNYIEPEFIVTQGLTRQVAAYLENIQYYEFSKSIYVATLKPGMTIAIDREAKWSISPYVIFPLNRVSRMQETRLGVGAVLTHTF
jgi:hypothetical protein